MKEHLERSGYEAKGEVCGCDIVAVLPGEPPFLVVTELKLGFTLDLVLQGVDRLAAADAVWLAVRATRRGRDRDGRARKLCRGIVNLSWRDLVARIIPFSSNGLCCIRGGAFAQIRSILQIFCEIVTESRLARPGST